MTGSFETSENGERATGLAFRDIVGILTGNNKARQNTGVQFFYQQATHDSNTVVCKTMRVTSVIGTLRGATNGSDYTAVTLYTDDSERNPLFMKCMRPIFLPAMLCSASTTDDEQQAKQQKDSSGIAVEVDGRQQAETQLTDFLQIG